MALITANDKYREFRFMCSKKNVNLKILKLSNPTDGYYLSEIFCEALSASGHSDNTLSSYRYDLSDFFRFVDTTIDNVNAESIRRYFQTQSNLAPSTRSRKLSTLNSFYKWLFKNAYIRQNPMLKIDQIKIPKRLPKPLSDEDFKKILDKIPPTNLRDRLLFVLIRETGIRASEALGIFLEDLSLENGNEHIVIRKGKGGKSRVVVLYNAPSALHYLKRYIKTLTYGSGPLFQRRNIRQSSNTAFSYRNLHGLFDKYCKKADIQASVHQLRHSFATDLLKNNVSVTTVQKLLGHERLDTTMLYIAIDYSMIKKDLLLNHRSKRQF